MNRWYLHSKERKLRTKYVFLYLVGKMEIEVRHNMLHKSLLLQRQVLSAIAYDWMNAHHSFFTTMVHDNLMGFLFISVQKLFKKSDMRHFLVVDFSNVQLQMLMFIVYSQSQPIEHPGFSVTPPTLQRNWAVWAETTLLVRLLQVQKIWSSSRTTISI